jgi:hypothetical protein
MKSLRSAGGNWNIRAHCHGLATRRPRLGVPTVSPETSDRPEKLPSWDTGGGLFVFFSKKKATNLVAGAGADAME